MMNQSPIKVTVMYKINPTSKPYEISTPFFILDASLCPQEGQYFYCPRLGFFNKDDFKVTKVVHMLLENGLKNGLGSGAYTEYEITVEYVGKQ